MVGQARTKVDFGRNSPTALLHLLPMPSHGVSILDFTLAFTTGARPLVILPLLGAASWLSEDHGV